MKNISIAVMTGALIALTPLQSQAAQPVATAAVAMSIAGISVLQAEGIVQAVDRAARSVTVKDMTGGQATFNVGDDLAKLAELRAGDKVRVRMVRDAVVTLMPHGAANGVRRTNALTSPTTDRTTAADATTQNTIAADIMSVDRKAGVLELKGPQGNVFHIQASDRMQLGHLSAGMHVEVAYAATATVSVSAAQ